MATKEQALEYIKSLAKTGKVSKNELISAFDSGIVTKESPKSKNITVNELFYFLGAGIVILGIVILVGQNWTKLDLVWKLLVTLGVAILTYIIGYFFGRDEKTDNLSSAFYLISSLLFPLGLWTLLNQVGYEFENNGIQLLISLLMFAVQLISLALFRKPIFLLFSILYGTWLFYASTNVLVDNVKALMEFKFQEHRLLVSSFIYLLLGYYFAKTNKLEFKGFLYGFGILGFLGAAFALGGFSPNQNLIWELIFPVLVLLTIFLSVNLMSKSFLVLGTLYLIAFILKITGEYFSNSLGWPISLVIAGFLIIGVGFLSYSINKKFGTQASI